MNVDNMRDSRLVGRPRAACLPKRQRIMPWVSAPRSPRRAEQPRKPGRRAIGALGHANHPAGCVKVHCDPGFTIIEGPVAARRIHPMQHLTVITTGGTIDKVYFDAKSDYQVGAPQIGAILAQLEVAFEFE